MRFWCLVLIAAVAVNSLVTTINAKSTSKTVIEPFNMLLPPLADKTEDVAVSKTSTKAASSASDTTAASVSKKTKKENPKTQTTLKPLINDVNDVALPELSIEALLPPLIEAKIEKAENNNKQQTAATTDEPTTLSTTTSVRTTTTTTTRTTKTPKTTTTTASIHLDALEPSLGDITNEGSSSTATSNLGEVKSTKKSFYQQQSQSLKKLNPTIDASAIQLEETEISPQETEESPDVAASNSKSNALPQNTFSDIEALATDEVVKQVGKQKPKTDSQSRSASNNYKFDLYLGSTTPRPAKQGLPTITPFPNRLGR